MAIDLNISSGQIDKGDTKTLRLVPKDADGNAITPQSITATFTAPSDDPASPSGDYAKADFQQDGDAWEVSHTFDEAGLWDVYVKATDASGNAEVETKKVWVEDN